MKKEIQIYENYGNVMIADENFFSTVYKTPRPLNIKLAEDLDTDEIQHYVYNCIAIFTTLELKASDADLIEALSENIVVEMINIENGFIYVRESNKDWNNVVEVIKSLHYEKLKDTSKTETTV